MSPEPTPSPPLSFTTSPSLVSSPLALSPHAFLAANPSVHRLIAGAVVISATLSGPKVLLLRRSPSDSFPLLWEVPGGSVDATDPSLPAAAARELWEESGLRARHVVCDVGLATTPGLPPPRAMMEVAEEVTLEGGGVVCVFREGETVWAKVTFLVDVEEGGEVVVREEEHVDWRWVGEEEVSMGLFEDGERLDIVSEGVWRTILEGFRIHKERVAVK